MADEQAACPFCKAMNAKKAEQCGACGAAFPWVGEISRLEEEMKSREPNRVRASVTLVKDLMHAAKTGGPVPLAAVQGFVASWMMPRAIIVAGSAFGVILIALQTWILWNQTIFTEQQTYINQVEMKTKLQFRITQAKLSHALFSKISYLYQDPVLNYAEYCKRPACLSADVISSQEYIQSGRLEFMDNSQIEAVVSLAIILNRSYDKIYRSMHVQNQERNPTNTKNVASISTTIASSIMSCEHHNIDFSRIIDRELHCLSLSEHVFLADIEHNSPSRAAAISESIRQDAVAMKNDILRFIEDFRDKKNEIKYDYTYENIMRDIYNARTYHADKMFALSSFCEKQIKSEISELELLQKNIKKY